MNRGFFGSLLCLTILALLWAAPAVLANDGFGLPYEDMLNRDKVIVYLNLNPEKAQFLAQDQVLSLLSYVEAQEHVALGRDLWMLQGVRFTLNMRLLDLQLEKLLHRGQSQKPTEHNPQHDKGGKYVNTAEVTAYGPLDVVVYDDDSAAVKPMHPAIAIEKSPDHQQVVSGKVAQFQVRVTNTGDVPLHDIRVMDPQAPGCELQLEVLQPGDSAHYACEVIASGDFDNIITATGDDPNGGAVVATDSAHVDAINPSIKIEKTPNLQRVAAGKPVIFSVTVTNTGDVPLHNVQVSDPGAPECQRMIEHLNVLESVSYDCVVVVGDPMEQTDYPDMHQPKLEPEHHYVEMAYSDPFATPLGCQLHQSFASLEARGSGLLIGVCEQKADGYWYFSTSKAM